jgi:hypothetical protein
MKVLHFLKEEFLKVLPPTIFFFITFCLLLMTRRLILREYGLPLTGFANAIIGALIVGKVVLVVDNFRFMNLYPHKPLIYNVLWKTSVYLLATLLVRYVEHLIPFVKQYGGIDEGNRHLLEEIIWPHFWLIQMWLVVLFFAFCSMRELIRSIGKTVFLGMFLGIGKIPELQASDQGSSE